jgi:hypothetical protein
MEPKKSTLPDETLARWLGLADLRIGRHSTGSDDLTGNQDF